MGVGYTYELSRATFRATSGRGRLTLFLNHGNSNGKQPRQCARSAHCARSLWSAGDGAWNSRLCSGISSPDGLGPGGELWANHRASEVAQLKVWACVGSPNASAMWHSNASLPHVKRAQQLTNKAGRTSRQFFIVREHELTAIEFCNGPHLVLRESEIKDVQILPEAVLVARQGNGRDAPLQEPPEDDRGD